MNYKLLALVVLTFCFWANAQSIQAQSTNKAHETINKMTDGDRNTFLGSYLRISGEQCPAVIRNFYQGHDKEGTAYWNAECNNKRAYVISIFNDKDGSSKILDCAILKVVKGGECFKKF